MTYPGPATPTTPGEQPHGATAAAQPGAEAPAEKSGVRKWLPIAGSVALAGVLGAGALTGSFGIGDPEVGDCVQMQGETSFEVVDCAASEAEYKIVGIEDQELTWPDFEAAAMDESICADFQTWEVALWIGELETEPGAIYCSEAV